MNTIIKTYNGINYEYIPGNALKKLLKAGWKRCPSPFYCSFGEKPGIIKHAYYNKILKITIIE
jgi:hypothetical protein